MAPDDGTDEETPLEQVVAGFVVASTLLVGFGLLALGYPWFWIAFPVGFAGVLPAAIGLVRLYESRRSARDDPEGDPRADALEALRERYARGEIDEEEFEERLDGLLETESVSEAQAYRSRGEIEREREAEGEQESV